MSPTRVRWIAIRRSAAALLAAFFLGTPPTAAAATILQPDPAANDALWSNGFGVPQFDGAVSCATRYHGGLVAGGEFMVAGGVPASHVAFWDGTRWSPLGDGVPQIPVSVAASGDTAWTAWNERSAAPSGWTGSIGAWHGGQWETTTDLPYILSMVLLHGRPVLLELDSSGYQVQTMGPGGWITLGAPGDIASSYGAALFADGDSLYFGGQFRNQNTASSTPVLEVWDGSAWSVRASVTNGPNSGYVLCVGSDAGRLMIGGLMGEVNGVPVENIAYRSGGAWHAMGSGLTPQVTQITDDGAGHPVAFGAYASSPTWGSTPAASVWNGSEWTLASNDLYPWAVGVVGHAGQLYAFGSFQQDGWRELHGFARLDASVARPVPSAGAGDGGLGGTVGGSAVNALASFGGAMVAAGSIIATGDTLIYDGGRGVMRLDGGTWRSITDGTYFGGRVLALHPYGDRLLAGGRFYMSLGFQAVNAIAQWDGTYWRPMGTVDDEVDAFAEYHGALYMGGRFGLADGRLCSGLATRHGSTWLPVGPIVVDTMTTAVLAMTVFQDRLIVAGRFEARSGTPAHNIAAWNGSSWSALPGGPTGTITALAATDSVLYVGVGPDPVDPVATLLEDLPIYAWNGSWWRTVDAPLNSGVRAMLATPAGLFVGADFQESGAGDPVGLARFDGTSWYGVASGVRGPAGWDCSVQALALLPDGLWVGGSFSTAGGKAASRVARYEGLAAAIPPPGSRVVSAAPSPTTSAFTLRFRIVNSGRVRVRLYDITGREVATVHDADHVAGAVVIPWDVNLVAGGTVRSGVYLLRIESPGEASRSSRIVIVR